MAKDLRALALARKLDAAEAAGDTDRVKRYKAALGKAEKKAAAADDPAPAEKKAEPKAETAKPAERKN